MHGGKRLLLGEVVRLCRCARSARFLFQADHGFHSGHFDQALAPAGRLAGFAAGFSPTNPLWDFGGLWGVDYGSGSGGGFDGLGGFS